MVDPDELDKLRTESDKAIQIDAFIAAGTLDPIYSNGKSYYLAPDGPVAQKGYAVLWRGMVEEKRHALAEVVMHGKEHVVWLRPVDGVIVVSQLHYDHQVTKPAALAAEVPKPEPMPQEMQLLRTLMAKCTPKQLDLAKYQDRYTAKLTQLIEAKVAGQEIVAAPASQPGPVINLVEALQQSLAAADKAIGWRIVQVENSHLPHVENSPLHIQDQVTPQEDSGIGLTTKGTPMTVEPSLPAFIEPMLATRGQPFDSQHYLFEIKWDGIRMLAFIDRGGYRLMNRHGVNTTERYPEFAFLAGLAPGTILDGEMVVLRHSGPDFALVQSRDKTRSPLKIRTLSRTQPATYIAFDLLYENLVPLQDLPWRQRRQRLENLLQQERDPHLVLSQAILGQGRALFAETCRQGLEGIMAKHVNSRYQPGRRSRDWLKIKPQAERNCAKDR